MPKIKVEKELYEKVKAYADRSGYASVDEFIAHLLEEVAGAPESEDVDEDVMERLKGLGYIS